MKNKSNSDAVWRSTKHYQRSLQPIARRLAQGLDPLKLRSSPKLGYGMVIDSKRLQVMEECVRRAGTEDVADRSSAPEARALTKALLLRVGFNALDAHLDQAALEFAYAARDGEGMSGMMAFISKQRPAWQPAWGEINLGDSGATDTSAQRGDER